MKMNQSKKLFADRTFNDLLFEMKGGKRFPAHSFVIAARCDALIPAKVKEALTNRKKSRQQAISLSDERITATAFTALLEYLYTGVVRYQSLSQRELIETYIAADVYKVERLKFLCKQHFTEQLKMDTVFTMLRDSHEYKCEALKNVAKKFAFDNYTTVISDKDGVKTLGVDLFQEIVSGYALRDAKSPRDAEAEPAEAITHDYKMIYEKMLFPDASASTARNEKLAFHRALLAVHSDAFVQMFGKNDEPSAGWDFRTLSADAFRAMQRYLYYGETEIAPLHACELVAFAREHQLAELVKLCKHMYVRINVRVRVRACVSPCLCSCVMRVMCIFVCLILSLYLLKFFCVFDFDISTASAAAIVCARGCR